MKSLQPIEVCAISSQAWRATHRKTAISRNSTVPLYMSVNHSHKPLAAHKHHANQAAMIDLQLKEAMRQP